MGRKKKKNPKRKKRWRSRAWVVGAYPAEDGRVLLMCAERPDTTPIAQQWLSPEDDLDAVVEEMLHRATNAPLTGAPRAPDRWVTNQPTLAASLEAVVGALGHNARVVVAPTPDLDRIGQVFALMDDEDLYEELPADLGYLDRGATREQIRDLFAAAADLFGAAPWASAHGDEPVMISCADLGLVDATVLVSTEEDSRGLLLFPDGDTLGDIATRQPDEPPERVVALAFIHAAALTTAMRRQAAEAAWPVAATDGYPLVNHLGEGETVFFAPDEVRAMTVCAVAVARLYEALGQGLAREERVVTTVGGSRVEATLGAASIHGLDRQLIVEVDDFAWDTYPEEWSRVARRFRRRDQSDWCSLGLPWAAYAHEIDGRPMIDWYLERQSEPVQPRVLDWVDAQKKAWLSIWEVREVSAGHGLTLRDALTGEERRVHDQGASRSVPPRAYLLARVVDFEGGALLCGGHPRVLSPALGQQAIDEGMRRLRWKRMPIAVERMRPSRVARALLAAWEDAIEAEDRRSARAFALRNTDGDPVLLTEDRYRFAPAQRGAIEAALRQLVGETEPDDAPGDGELEFAIARPGNAMHANWDNTIVAHVRLAPAALVIATNSLRRADDARAIVEDALGDRIAFVARSHDDPTSEPHLAGIRERANDPVAEPPPEALAVLRQFLEDHYRAWLDMPLPILDGATPRETAKTREGRARAARVLAEMEHGQAAMPPHQRYDFAPLRAELGLDP